jgi:hypothetical protein
VSDALKAKGQPPVAAVSESTTAAGLVTRYLDSGTPQAMATEKDYLNPNAACAASHR